MISPLLDFRDCRPLAPADSQNTCPEAYPPMSTRSNHREPVAKAFIVILALDEREGGETSSPSAAPSEAMRTGKELVGGRRSAFKTGSSPMHRVGSDPGGMWIEGNTEHP
jgi:hypothetical protein